MVHLPRDVDISEGNLTATYKKRIAVLAFNNAFIGKTVSVLIDELRTSNSLTERPIRMPGVDVLVTASNSSKSIEQAKIEKCSARTTCISMKVLPKCDTKGH